MSRVETAGGMDRLPWLPDEPAAKSAPRRRGGLYLSMGAVVLLVAGGAFWFGARSMEDQPPPAPAPHRTATVRLPAPVLPQVKLAPVPEVEPIVAPPEPVIEPPQVTKRAFARPVAKAPEPGTHAIKQEAAPPPPARPLPPQPWPVRVVDGAAGRLVRVGAFSSVHQAKRGWWAIVKVNPALKRLPALVVPVQSLRNGQVYYRLQMGTTSQAHSAVLCQRMRMIAEPCVVIGVAALS